MKIMLVRPRPSSETIGLQHVMICEPLELEYLCAAINDLGHESLIVDMILEKDSIDHFLLKHKPDVLALTGYITHVNIIKDDCRTAKVLLPDCRTVVGGVHAEVVPEDFQDPNIDFIIRANGIPTFRQLIQSLSNESDTSCIPGTWSPSHPPCSKETTFTHPVPDRSKTDRYRSRYYYLFHNPCALIKTSFGCPFQCSFCFCREITNGTYFERDLNDVIEELKSIPEPEIYIVDDNFLVSRQRVLDFCRRLKNENINKRFLIYGRADFIAANEDVIATFKEQGLRAVIVGLESCTAGELDQYNKQNDVATNEAAVNILTQHNVDCYATLILGMDWSTTDFKRLGKWLRHLRLTFINLQPFTPLPGTAPFKQYESQLVVPREAYENWDLAHLVLRPENMSPARYYWNIIKLYHTVTMRPANLLHLLRRHGLRENLKLLAGSTRVTFQYLKKVFPSLEKPGWCPKKPFQPLEPHET